MPAVHIVVSGRVQGVGYRAFFEREALAARVDGWVRNRRDGSVEAVISGSPAAIESVLEAAHRGPPASRVIDVAEEVHSEAVAKGFAVLPTA